jgi:chemotaxis protein histidine kinase CheA
MTESELRTAAQEAANKILSTHGTALRPATYDKIAAAIVSVAEAHAAGLREELKDEKEACTAIESMYRTEQTVNDRLRAEVAALKAEIDRLTQSHVKWERVAHEAAVEIDRLKAEIDEDNQFLADYAETFTTQADTINKLRAVCREVAEVLDLHEAYRCSEVGREEILASKKRLEDACATEKHPDPATKSEPRNQGQILQPAPSKPKCGRESCNDGITPLCALCAGTEACRETFGSKHCVRPAGHDGHHESRSGSCWPIQCVDTPAPSAPEQERCNATATHQDRKHTCTAPVGHDGPHYGGKAFGWYDDWPSSTPHTPQPAKEKAAADALTRESRAEYEQPAPAVEGEPRRYPVDCTCFCMWERTQERDAARAEVDKLRAELAAYKEQLDESAGYAHDREIECKVALGQVEHLRAELAKACEEARMQKARKESYQEDAVQLRAINEQLTLQLEAAHDWWCKAPNFDRGGDE